MKCLLCPNEATYGQWARTPYKRKAKLCTACSLSCKEYQRQTPDELRSGERMAALKLRRIQHVLKGG